MSERESMELSALSDSELLDAVENLLCTQEFLDLALAFDHETKEFYAGCESAATLRDLLRMILLHNRPSGITLERILPTRCADRVA